MENGTAERPLSIGNWQNTEQTPDDRQDIRFWHRLGKVAAGSVLAAVPMAGVAAGAYEGVQVPTTINLGEPGVNVDVSAQFKDYSEVAFGSPASLQLPVMHQHYPVLGDVAGKITVREVNVNHPDKSDTEQLAALLDDDGAALKNKMQSAITWRAGEGAGVGLGAGILADSLLVAGWGAAKRKHFVKLGAGLAGAAVVGSGLGVGIYQPGPADETRVVTQLDPAVTAQYPILERATLTGTGGQGLESFIEMVLKTKNHIDHVWQKYSDEFTETADQFRAEGNMDIQNDPNIVTIMHMTDLHGNIPEMTYFLPNVVRTMGVDIIANTGDQENTGGTTMLDYLAWRDLLDNTDKPIVFAPGNHDPYDTSKDVANAQYRGADGEMHRQVYVLDKRNKFMATVDGVPFVGSPDRNRTTTGNTVPFTLDAQMKNDAKQGRQTAGVACFVKRKTKVSPIELVHEEPAGYASLLEGCTQLLLSGHWHETHRIRAFEAPDGSVEYIQNLGSASGDGPGNWKAWYSLPTAKRGSLGFWFYDKSTQQVVGQVRLDIYPDSPPRLFKVNLPQPKPGAEPEKLPRIHDFMNQYQPQLPPRQALVAEAERSLRKANAKSASRSHERRSPASHRGSMKRGI